MYSPGVRLYIHAMQLLRCVDMRICQVAMSAVRVNLKVLAGRCMLYTAT
jgi:hypothetical protein